MLFLYFGITHQIGEPSYPLTWINLKIKTKRLQKMNYLKYSRFHVAEGETEGENEEHDCCFCLETLKRGTKVA